MSSFTMTSAGVIRLMARPAGDIGSVAAQDGAEGLEAEPREVVAGVDGGVAESFEEVALARPARPADHDVLVALDPLQGP